MPDEPRPGSAGSAPRWTLQPSQPLAGELVRVLKEQLAFLGGWASTDRADLGEATHRVRQTLKRVRALGWLMRAEVSADAFDLWNRRLRDEGRRLGTARDADVALETLDLLCAEERLRGAAIDRLRDQLVGAAREARREIVESGALRRCLRSARELEAPLADSVPGHVGADDLRKGAARAYQRARRQLARIEEARTDERLHELRKRAKIVRSHVELLARSGAWRRAALNRLEEINDLLGADHDRVILAAAVRRELEGAPQLDGDLLALLGAIDVRRRALQSEALRHALHAFDHKSSDFAEQLLV